MRADHTDTTPVHTLPREFQEQRQENDEAQISLVELWRILMDERRLIGAVTAGVVFVALALALFSTPVYQASVLLAPADPAKDSGMASAIGAQLGGFAQFAGINLGSTDTAENIAILKSRAFTEKFVREENLMPILFKDRWDARSGQWKKDKPFFPVAWIRSALNTVSSGARRRKHDAPTAWQAYRKFNEIRSVSTDAISGLITLKVKWKDPELAAEWANKLVERLNGHVRLWTREEALRSQRYINEQLAHTDLTEMQQILHRLLEEQVKTVMLTGIRSEFAFRIVDPAVAPERPAWPPRLLLLIIGFTMGVLAGISAALVRVYIRKEFKKYVRLTGERLSARQKERARWLPNLRKLASRAMRQTRSSRSPAEPLPAAAIVREGATEDQSEKSDVRRTAMPARRTASVRNR